MAMWRCPHCGTPQAETARCWVCHRSSTACATCRHFRRSVAAQLGYCGLDRARKPLRGDEIRGCWEAAIAVPDEPDATPSRPLPTSPAAPDAIPDRTPVRRMEFVEVGTGRPIDPTRPARKRRPDAERRMAAARVPIAGTDPTDTPVVTGSPPPVADESRWSLWSDAEV
jgi:hypothetical protein